MSYLLDEKIRASAMPSVGDNVELSAGNINGTTDLENNFLLSCTFQVNCTTGHGPMRRASPAGWET